MKKIYLFIAILASSFTFLAQDSPSNINVEYIDIPVNDYFSNSTKDFMDYQSFFVNKSDGNIILMNGEVFGVPQNPTNKILVFSSDELPSNYSIKIVSDTKTTEISKEDMTSISDTKTNLYISLFDENNIEISKVAIK
ncbi:MAG: hypothetical protein ACI9N1_000512 [Flavobacteriales bacterium]|jgi:hypothetical protein